MSETNPLTVEFARRFPDQFTRLLARGEPAEIEAQIAALPPGLAAGIAARLPHGRLQALLAAGRVHPGAWLEVAPYDDAVALLGALPRERALALVEEVSERSRRRRLRQFLSYPAHCVGALVTDALVRVAAGVPIAEALATLQASEPVDSGPAVIVEREGKYAGVLNLWRTTTRSSDETPVGEFAEAVPPLRPETPLASAAHAAQWEEHGWLPVVDHASRVLGVVSRSRVLESLGNATPDSFVPGTLASLGEQYFSVMREFLAWLLSPRRTP